MTYDVTAIGRKGRRVPLTVSTSYSVAHEIARPRSMDGRWSAVEICEAGTGTVIATYVDGAADSKR
jgi:hypothetical protein